MLDNRLEKDMYYLRIAESVASRSTCMRRAYGAIIVNHDEIISTGYNGSPRGCLNCNEVGCIREILGTGKGDAYNLCASVHAEQNAVISAARKDMLDSTIYIVGVNMSLLAKEKYADCSPCLLCHRLLLNAGVTRCVGIRTDENGLDVPYEIDISGDRFMERLQDETRKTINQAALDGMELEAANKFVLTRHMLLQKKRYQSPN